LSSTNKTQNLELNLWVPEDPVLMEDFNADNQKLDLALARANTAIDGASRAAEQALRESAEAVSASIDELRAAFDSLQGSLRLVKLIDVTTTKAAASVSLNLSGIDMTQFTELTVYQDAGYTRRHMHYRVNGQSSNAYYLYLNNDGRYLPHETYVCAYAGKSSLVLLGSSIITHGAWMFNGLSHTTAQDCNVLVSCSGAQLRSIDMLWSTNNNDNRRAESFTNVPAGVRFIVLGVRK
jgi:hypothetical protein